MGRLAEKPKVECTHEQWCKNESAFVVDSRPTCSIHLASACRFALSLSEVMYGDHRGVKLNGIAERVSGNSMG